MFSVEALGVGGDVIGAARNGDDDSDGEPGWSVCPATVRLGSTAVETSERLLGAVANPLRSPIGKVDDWLMAPGETDGRGVNGWLTAPIGWEATAAGKSERLPGAAANPSRSSADIALNDWLMAPGGGSSLDDGVDGDWLTAPPGGGRCCRVDATEEVFVEARRARC